MTDILTRTILIAAAAGVGLQTAHMVWLCVAVLWAGLGTAADRPFLEPVTVLREWRGEAAGDQFGWIARNLGDVDGDGVADVVTSAPTWSGAGKDAGRVYVFSTGRDRMLWRVDGMPGDELGTGLESAGDTDGDGVADVIATAPGRERAWIYSGRDGAVLLTLTGPVKGSGFGASAAGIGDMDGDGRDDVIVGAPTCRVGPAATGCAYVFSGRTGATLQVLEGEHAGDGFGSAVAGRLRRGRGLVVVGAGTAGPRHRGRVSVFRDGGATPAHTLTADGAGRALGAMFVAIPGDVDGDGDDDVFASDWKHALRGLSTGRIYVLSGRSGRVWLTLSGSSAGEGFGTSASVAGDVDGDGHADLLVGAWQFGGGAKGAGRTTLFSGRDGRVLARYTCAVPGDAFGFDAVTVGDTDRDGTDDFVITSGWSGVNGKQAGRVFVISSGIRKLR